MSESERVLFDVPAVAYDRLMGRYLPTLAPALADAAGVASGSGRRVLDVGCGPGGLTRVLVERVGPGNVVAIDPSPPFVAACAERNPGVDVHEGVAEQLPFDDDAFDASLASLVIGFMTDPHAGVAEMRRVTRQGGRLALSFWTLDTMPVLSTFWRAAGAVTGATSNDGSRFGRRDGEIAGVLRDVGATDVEQLRLTCRTTYADVDDFFSSFTGQAGPVGVYLASLPEADRDRVRDEVDRLLGHPRSPFTLEPVAWCGVGTA